MKGTLEVRQIAQAVNGQADEADLLRAQEAEGNRLRAIARTAGIRIREPLTADAVIAEARTALKQSIEADAMDIHLMTDGRIQPPVAGWRGWKAGGAVSAELPTAVTDKIHDLLRSQSSLLIQNAQGPAGEQLPEWHSEPGQDADAASQILTPFGVGDQVLGLIVAIRLRPGHWWSTAEVDAIESIAADLGRGLNHARLYEAETRLVAHLESLDRAKSDFFATVSHELGAPLTSIEGYAEMLSDEEAGPITPLQRRMLQTIDRSISRLRRLTDDVFTLAKLESGAFATKTDAVNIPKIIAGAVEEIRLSAAAGMLTLTSSVPHDRLVVDGDAGQLERLLTNLLSNAVKYTPQGGRVEVSAYTERQSVVIRVSDTGIGVPQADQKNLFTKFYRASNARQRDIPGTGLGLAIVQTIVTGHHGTISLDSKEGVGTAITVRLPQHNAAPPPVRAENVVHAPDQQGCLPAVRP